MRSFNVKTDLDDLNCWLIARNIDPLEEKDVPKMGKIVPGIACGFIVNTDSSTCFLECFVSNKEALIEERSKALHQIAKWGKYQAEIIGYKRVIAITSSRSMLALAEDIGFEFKDTKLAYLNL